MLKNKQQINLIRELRMRACNKATEVKKLSAVLSDIPRGSNCLHASGPYQGRPCLIEP